MALSPGAKDGLKKVFGVTGKVASEELEMTQTLTGLMDPVFDALGINFQYFLGRRISLKAIEHSLCEFDKIKASESTKEAAAHKWPRR